MVVLKSGAVLYIVANKGLPAPAPKWRGVPLCRAFSSTRQCLPSSPISDWIWLSMVWAQGAEQDWTPCLCFLLSFSRWFPWSLNDKVCYSTTSWGKLFNRGSHLEEEPEPRVWVIAFKAPRRELPACSAGETSLTRLLWGDWMVSPYTKYPLYATIIRQFTALHKNSPWPTREREITRCRHKWAQQPCPACHVADENELWQWTGAH